MREAYEADAAVVLSTFETRADGLLEHEAESRLSADGPNTLPEGKRRSYTSIFLSQFQSPLIYVLLVAAAVVMLIGEMLDGAIILVVLIFNALVGSLQEGRAEETLRALRSFVSTTATVVRNGVERIIADRAVVTGDIILLAQGEKVPADARLISVAGLRIDESALTGESIPVAKDTETLVGARSPQEQRNMVFRGTLVAAGSARAVVVATGIRTMIGGIAQEILSVNTEVPLAREVRRMSHYILAAVAALSITLFIYGVSVGYDALTMFSVVVSLAVSVIPEGLPIVLTLVLASGVWRMSKRNALVKRLQAVEALGQAHIIAVDKTGTITKNELVVRHVVFADSRYEVGGVGYAPEGEVVPTSWSNDARLKTLAEVAALAGDAHVAYRADEKRYRVSGDPTDAALLVLAEKLGVSRVDLTDGRSPLYDIPFDFVTKFHGSVHHLLDEAVLVVAGAPESVFERVTHVLGAVGASAMTNALMATLETHVNELSEAGLRVIALAKKTFRLAHVGSYDVEGLTLVGLVAMQDGLRPGVAHAIAEARAAGMRVVMVTGDHKTTARAIAREAGIYTDGDEVITGADLDQMTGVELERHFEHASVFARVTPAHKLEIIEAYKKRGDVVAMTGDGVNDAPSLVAADLGVAMGLVGTEVAKEAADIVILDDNFSSIVAAVEEGRSIYRTIKKVVLYLFSTSAGEVLTIVAALLIALPLPLLSSQIIWLNFVTDGFLTVALAMESKESGLLRGGVTAAARHLVDRAMLVRMLVMAVPMAFGTLCVFAYYAQSDMAVALTMSLTTLAVFQWFNAWNCRSDTESVFRTDWQSNMWLVYATGVVVFLQIMAVHVPALQYVLHTVPLSLADWGIAVLVASSVVLVEEMRKYTVRVSLRLRHTI